MTQNLLFDNFHIGDIVYHKTSKFCMVVLNIRTPDKIDCGYYNKDEIYITRTFIPQELSKTQLK